MEPSATVEGAGLARWRACSDVHGLAPSFPALEPPGGRNPNSMRERQSAGIDRGDPAAVRAAEQFSEKRRTGLLCASTNSPPNPEPQGLRPPRQSATRESAGNL